MSLNEPNFNETITSAPTDVVSISEIDNFSNGEKNNIIPEPIELISEEVNEFQLYLQVFNFNDYKSIKTIVDTLNQDINFTSEKNGSKYNLILGPINKNEINNLVSYFISKGYKETKIILN